MKNPSGTTVFLEKSISFENTLNILSYIKPV